MLKAQQKSALHGGALHGGYVSEFTQFIDHFLADHPEVVKSREDGWHIYWDRVVDFDELKKAAQESSPVLPYYFPNSTQGRFHAGVFPTYSGREYEDSYSRRSPS